MKLIHFGCSGKIFSTLGNKTKALLYVIPVYDKTHLRSGSGRIKLYVEQAISINLKQHKASPQSMGHVSGSSTFA